MKSQRQRIAAYALLHQEGKILLCRLTEETGWPGYWGLPGGGLEFGESPEEAMKREVYEETGLRVIRYSLETIDNLYDVNDGSEFHAIRIIYRVTEFVGTLRNEIAGSTDMCAWQPLHASEGIELVDLAQVGVGVAQKIWPEQAYLSPEAIWNRRYARDDYAKKILPNNWLEPWVHLMPKGKALDIGCGLGRDTKFLL
ncbi:MAG: NUDIX domain-containing protein [Opitutales bacterium]